MYVADGAQLGLDAPTGGALLGQLHPHLGHLAFERAELLPAAGERRASTGCGLLGRAQLAPGLLGALLGRGELALCPLGALLGRVSSRSARRRVARQSQLALRALGALLGLAA